MAETLTNPHDSFFRQVMSRQDVATDFLRHYLPPEAAAQVNLSSMEATSETFVDEHLRSYHSDMVFAVRLKDNRPAVVYVLFEHKSYPDVRVAFQMLRYMVRIWERWPKQSGALQPIIPLVVYHGQWAWRTPINLMEKLSQMESTAEFVATVLRYLITGSSTITEADLRSPWKSTGQKE